MAVFLVVSALFIGASYAAKDAEGEAGVFGGPLSEGEIQGTDHSAEATLDAATRLARGSQTEVVTDPSFPEAALSSDNINISHNDTGNSVFSYVIERGDTVARIAEKFGISPQTVLWANPGVRSGSLRAGDTITILAVSGILYPVREGETPESIASSFGLTFGQLQEFNKGVNFAELGVGVSLIIPGARPEDMPKTVSSAGKLPRLPGYFILPTRGFNWGRLHVHNAVDIANSCGTEVVAAAEGLVVPDDSLNDGASGWNGGYGKFVFIEHPNGTKTRYAHLESTSVKIGDYLRQGDVVGAMGNTGNVQGVTGCHVHFEVYGAQNPFVK